MKLYGMQYVQERKIEKEKAVTEPISDVVIGGAILISLLIGV